MTRTILHITKYYYPDEGGIEAVAKYMAEGLSDYQNIVVCYDHHGPSRSESINGITVHRIASSIKIASQDITFSYYSHLKKLIGQYQPDIILLHCPNPFLYPIVCRLKSEHSKLALLWHSDILGKGILYKFVRTFEQKILRKADVILTTSSNYIHPSSPVYGYRNKVKVVPNGVDDSKFTISADEESKIEDIRKRYGNKKMILFVGRHVKYKGIEYLIRSEKFIKSDCVIVIGGSGPETDSLKLMVHSDRIKIIGRIPDEELKYYYHAADIFGFSSITKQEAFGVALAEAMYCKCVPVTFTIEGSGVNWVSVKGETGEEVPLGDEKAFASAIDRLLTDQALHQCYAEAGHKRIKEMFTCEKANQEATEIFNNLLTH